MKRTVYEEEIRTAQPEDKAGGPEFQELGFSQPQGVAEKRGISRILSKLPSLPRFEDKAQRRAGGNIVKFMAGLLALTLIARGTSGATLARVDVSAPSRGEIVEAVTGSAVVSARDTIDVFAPEGLTVVEMLVSAGQTVNFGDAVALFGASEVQEKLIRETASLDKLLIELEKLEREVDTDSSSVESAARNLSRAKEDYRSIEEQGKEDVDAARKVFDEALAKLAEDPDAAALNSAWRALRRAQEDQAATYVQGEADIRSAQAALKEAQDAKDEPVDSASVDNARRNRDRAREDYNAVVSQNKNLVDAATAVLSAALEEENEKKDEWENAGDGDKDEKYQEYLQAQAETQKARDALTAAEKKAADDQQTARRRLEDAEATLSQAQKTNENNSQQASNARQNAVDNARKALSTAQQKASDNLLSASRRVEDAETTLSQAQQNYDKNIQNASDARLTSIDNAHNALGAAQQKAADNLLSALRRVEDAEAAHSQAKQNFDKSALQSADTAVQNSAGAVTARLDVEKQKAVVDALSVLAAGEGTLYSDVAGVAANTKAKGSVTGKDALISFMDNAKGFEAYLTLDRTEADLLTVGEECQVATGGGSLYYNPTAAGMVSAIAPPDDQDKVKVTIRLPEGSWTDGQRVDVRAVKSRDTYDMCFPLSALRSDNTGYYLLTVEQKSTVLGVENVVVRVPVNVLAEDDDMAAVQGPLDRSSQIVTGSNKVVTAGDRVRLNS